MPYIKQEDRVRVISLTREIEEAEINNPGELNYLITSLLIRYIEQHGLNYQHINDCLGALRGADHEFYRRVAAPYEITKIAENGDVF
jgi:hypothetical protein